MIVAEAAVDVYRYPQLKYITPILCTIQRFVSNTLPLLLTQPKNPSTAHDTTKSDMINDMVQLQRCPLSLSLSSCLSSFVVVD